MGFGCGRRGRATRTGRRAKHALVSARISRFTRATRRYHVTLELGRDGGQPAGTYGFKCMGCLEVRSVLASEAR
eukprot:8271022-Pyramimonas_sp.AAC.1